MRTLHLRSAGLALVVAAAAWAWAVAPAQPQPGPGGHMAAGNAAFEREDWPAAVEAYQRALAAGLDVSLLHFRLGYALHVTGKHEQALRHHVEAAHIPHPALRIDALYNAACACALLGRKDEALAWFQKAVDAGFKDMNQVRIDTDLDALRADPRFTAMVEGIGTVPKLGRWMDFFIGDWTCYDVAHGGVPAPVHGAGAAPREVILGLKIERPLEQSQALVTTSVQPARVAGPPPTVPHATGLLYPDAVERVWRWTYTDGIGTHTVLTGERIETEGGTSMRFTGREVSPAGPGAHVRLTYTPLPDGRVAERGETSSDGEAWRTHHEAEYVKRDPGGG